jgi:predicted O-linked N-acetylglucosamine transferase (SPINDLY family)
MAARASESMLRAAGLPELVAADRDAYVRTAVRLGTQPGATRELKRRLSANRSSAPLFDTVARVRALETAFRKMHERSVRGLLPVSFDA